MPKYSPNELYEKYKNGFEGAIWNQYEFDHLMATLKYPLFGDASKKITGSGKGKLSTPYKSVLKFDKKAYEERQTTGDCVSHGTRNACDVTRAVEIDINGEHESWIARGATEVIYGARGWTGEGMTGSKAAQFVTKIGGILVRQNYKGVVDLSKYNGSLGASWGGRGVPDAVLDLANDHQMKTTSLIRTIEEARDALANGYGIAVCSNYGFSGKRDSKGFAKVQGNWGHCMYWGAADDTNGDLAFLVQNSWGKWNEGGHPEWGPIPDGSFLIHSDVAQGMLSQNGAYAFSNFNGFPVQKLPSYGFEEYL
jgi:hypothetical protein